MGPEEKAMAHGFLSFEADKPLSAPDYSQFKWSIAISAKNETHLNFMVLQGQLIVVMKAQIT